MKLIHSGATYECDVAVKCENDKYIKLYDANGIEIVSFNNISDFSDYTLSGGSFVDPCDCAMPIMLSTYSIGGRTIKTSDWIRSSSGQYCYEIESGLISANATTCNISLMFAAGTVLAYEAKQEAGKIVLSTASAPLVDIVIDSILIQRA